MPPAPTSEPASLGNSATDAGATRAQSGTKACSQMIVRRIGGPERRSTHMERSLRGHHAIAYISALRLHASRGDRDVPVAVHCDLGVWFV